MPRVVSLWFPTLPTDRLRVRRAAPADGALVTAAVEQGRRIVAACSAEARRAGARPGQPLAEARVLVPGLVVTEADPPADAVLLRRLAHHGARRWTPLVAIDGADGLLCDVTASAHLHARAGPPEAGGPGEAGLLRLIARTCRRLGLAPRAAIADTAGAAHALARFGPRPLTIVPAGGDAQAVAPLPPAALRLEAGAVETLHRLGFDTIGAILAAPRATLVRRFGAGFAMRVAQLLGHRAEPIAPLIPPEIPHATRSLLEPIGTPEAIAQVIQDLAGDLCDDLEARGQGARQALLVCRRIDARAETVTIGLARASRDAAHLADLLRRRIETIDPGFGIEAMTLAATRVQPLAPEQTGQRFRHAVPHAGGVVVALPGHRLPDAEPPPEPDLAALVDRLASRFGGAALHRAAPAESDVPTRSVARLAPLARPAARDWRPDWPRPPRLLARAEAAGVTALLPDHAPKVFTWRGRRYAVTASDGPERLHGEWWRGGARYATRDYFQVEVEGGGRYWLFRRGDGDDPETGPGDWFVHGAFG